VTVIKEIIRAKYCAHFCSLSKVDGVCSWDEMLSVCLGAIATTCRRDREMGGTLKLHGQAVELVIMDELCGIV
jgi:hypothetical protein